MLIDRADIIERDYASWLADESRLGQGRADALLIPAEPAEAAALLSGLEGPITLSGGRSGITGGAVPQGGTLLSTANLRRIEGPFERDGRQLVRVGGGVSISMLTEYLRTRGLFYAPDPTESSASIGGSLATNASGARSYKYGPTRCHIEALEAITVDGRILQLRRGQVMARDGLFCLPDGGKLPAPGYRMPAAKLAAGYYSRPGMDLVDLLIGSEGTLALITGAELRLLPAPKEAVFLLALFPSEAAAFRFASLIGGRDLESLEYFDSSCLRLLRAGKHLAGLPDRGEALVMMEEIIDKKDFADICRGWQDDLEACGSSLDLCFYRQGDYGNAEMKAIRHALPEAVNSRVSQNRLIEPQVHKLSTDTAVPSPAALAELIGGYRSHLQQEGIEHYVFGHLGEHHLHVNMLPDSAAGMEKGRLLAKEFARAAVRLGGSVSAEHGIGRMKRYLMSLQYDDQALKEMHGIKGAWDPDWRLNPGVLL